MRCIECKRAMTMTLVGQTTVHHCEECGASVKLIEPSIGQYNYPTYTPSVIDPAMIRGDEPENVGKRVTHATYGKATYKDKTCAFCPTVFTPTNGAQTCCSECRETVPERVRKAGRPAVLSWKRKHGVRMGHTDFGAVP